MSPGHLKPVTRLRYWRFRSTSLSRPKNIRWGNVRPSVGTSVHTSVRPYVHPQKVCPISMKFGVYIQVDEWCKTVCRMTRFKVKVTGPLKFRKFQVYLLRHLQWELANDRCFVNYSTISKFGRAGFLIFILLLLSHDLELGGIPGVSPSRKKSFRFQRNLVCISC